MVPGMPSSPRLGAGACAGTKDGRAAVSVGGRSVSCTEGQVIDAGPLTVTCSGITADSVKLTVRPG